MTGITKSLIASATAVLTEENLVIIPKEDLPKDSKMITKVTNKLAFFGHGTMWNSKDDSIMVSPTSGRDVKKDIVNVLKQFS